MQWESVRVGGPRTGRLASVETVTQGQLDARVLRPEGPVALDLPGELSSLPRVGALSGTGAREYEGRLRVYRVDIVAQRFGIMSIPTILLLKGGQEVERLDGLITEQDLRAAEKPGLRPFRHKIPPLEET